MAMKPCNSTSATVILAPRCVCWREAERARVAAALRRIESGDYGYCLNCDEEIDARRLEIDPAEPLCLDCARGKI